MLKIKLNYKDIVLFIFYFILFFVLEYKRGHCGCEWEYKKYALIHLDNLTNKEV